MYRYRCFFPWAITQFWQKSWLPSKKRKKKSRLTGIFVVYLDKFWQYIVSLLKKKSLILKNWLSLIFCAPLRNHYPVYYYFYFILFLKVLSIYLKERGEGVKKRTQADSAPSTGSDVGLNLTTLKSWPEQNQELET